MDFAGLRVLVVDDDQTVSALLSDLLVLWGCEVEMALNGEEGVDKYLEFRPNIVIMDLEMPIMNGYNASRKIVELDPHASILLVTGFPDTILAQKAQGDRLVRALVPKPFHVKQIEMAIQEVIGQKRALLAETVR